MRQAEYADRVRDWIVDYSAARAKAIEWLGERYLLAKPVNRRSSANQQRRAQPPARASERWTGGSP